MAAEPEDIADPDEEPFSPSIFLNLSPTPPHPDDQDPNHQAPQPSTDEISCIANTIDGGVGTCFTLSPCFPDTAPVLDGVTWPYDPVELSQKLLSSTTTPYPNNIGRDGGLTMGGGAGETAARNRVTMDMLNQAFLKGMEEATKFLPTNNSLLVHLEATSESGDRHGIKAHPNIQPCPVMPTKGENVADVFLRHGKCCDTTSESSSQYSCLLQLLDVLWFFVPLAFLTSQA